MSDKIDIQQIIDDLDAAQAYVSPYVYRRHDDNTQVRMVESLKRASSILCRLTDSEVSLLGEVERLEAKNKVLTAALKYPRFGDTAGLLEKAAEYMEGQAGDGWTSLHAHHYRNAAQEIRAALSGNEAGEGE